MEPKYIMECGCRIKRSQLKRNCSTKNGVKLGVKVCPTHYRETVGIECECQYCGRVIVKYREGKRRILPSQTCDECHAKKAAARVRERHKRLRKEAGKEYTPIEELKIPRLIRVDHLKDLSRIDCVHWDKKCLDKYAEKNYSCRPCLNCLDYLPEGLTYALPLKGDGWDRFLPNTDDLINLHPRYGY